VNFAIAGRDGGAGHGEFALAGLLALADTRGAMYLPDLRTLVVSDLHLEKGAASARRGRLVPPYDTAATLALLERSIERFAPELVVSLGDSFDDRTGAEHMLPLFRDRLAGLMRGRDWIWVSGNHDPDPPKGLGGTCVAEIAVGPLVFRHEPSRNPAPGEVAGHLHPGARIVQRGRSVRRRCFATDGERLIMPSFGAYTGALSLRDRAFAGLFCEERLVALMLGSERVYAVPRRRLV
jgi:uncharacterized protein